LENEGSLDATTSDFIIGSSHQSSDNVTFWEENFLGRDIDGDGAPDKGESVSFNAYEKITKFDPYLTVEEALEIKDGVWDSWVATNGRRVMREVFAEYVGGEYRIYIAPRQSWFGNGGSRWYPKKDDTVFQYGRLPGAHQRGRLSFTRKELSAHGLPHWGSSLISSLKMDMTVENIATSDTTFFDTVRYSESMFGGLRMRLGSVS